MNNTLLNAHHFMKNKSPAMAIDVSSLIIKGEFYCDRTILDIFLKSGNVFVTQGFIASTSDMKYCILTRSGSNTSASLIANILDASRLEIWSDTNGLFTADPRKIENAKLIKDITYKMCQEASAVGTQMIHPYSIKPCSEKKIPIHIKNTFCPEEIGTVINCHDKEHMHKSYMISYQGNITVFKISSMDMWEGHGFVSDIFSVFGNEKIDVDIITTSQFSITTTTTEKIPFKLTNVSMTLSKKYKVNVIKNCAVVSVITEQVSKNKLVHEANKLISEIPEKIHMIHYGDNDMTLSYVVDEIHANKFMNILHRHIIE